MYGYLTLRPDDGYTTVEFGYGGRSWRRHGVRDREHRVDLEQPWADIIVGPVHIIADGWWTPAELDGLEQAVIGGRWGEVAELIAVEAARRGVVPDLSGMQACMAAGPQPRYNIADGGLDNPDHIPQWTAVEQRHARDVAAGRTLWQPPAERVRVPAQRGWAGAPAVGVSWPRRIARRAGAAIAGWLGRLWSRVWPWLTAWLAIAVPAAVGVLWKLPDVKVVDACGLGGAVATAVLVWWATVRKPRRRRARGTRTGKGRSRLR